AIEETVDHEVVGRLEVPIRFLQIHVMTRVHRRPSSSRPNGSSRKQEVASFMPCVSSGAYLLRRAAGRRTSGDLEATHAHSLRVGCHSGWGFSPGQFVQECDGREALDTVSPCPRRAPLFAMDLSLMKGF